MGGSDPAQGPGWHLHFHAAHPMAAAIVADEINSFMAMAAAAMSAKQNVRSQKVEARMKTVPFSRRRFANWRELLPFAAAVAWPAHSTYGPTGDRADSKERRNSVAGADPRYL